MLQRLPRFGPAQRRLRARQLAPSLVVVDPLHVGGGRSEHPRTVAEELAGPDQVLVRALHRRIELQRLLESGDRILRVSGMEDHVAEAEGALLFSGPARGALLVRVVRLLSLAAEAAAHPARQQPLLPRHAVA